jgi:predicted restriction endonuclease
MITIETYLDNLTDNKLPTNIFHSHEYFGYEYEEVFKYDLTLLLNCLYPSVSFVGDKKVRLEQKEFKVNLLKLYNGKCIISGINNISELNACHIIPVKDDGDYSNNNGLLMTCNLHATFDNFEWSINPKTLKIEINSELNINSTFKEFTGKTVNLNMNPFLYKNLSWHYDKFLQQTEL